jgi:hypothetical protein
MADIDVKMSRILCKEFVESFAKNRIFRETLYVECFVMALWHLNQILWLLSLAMRIKI